MEVDAVELREILNAALKKGKPHPLNPLAIHYKFYLGLAKGGRDIKMLAHLGRSMLMNAPIISQLHNLKFLLSANFRLHVVNATISSHITKCQVHLIAQGNILFAHCAFLLYSRKRITTPKTSTNKNMHLSKEVPSHSHCCCFCYKDAKSFYKSIK